MMLLQSLLKNKTLVVIGVIVLLLLGIGYLWNTKKTVEQKYEQSMGNVKAYAAELDSAQKQKRAFQLTIDQLSYFKDSLFQKMNEERKLLKIKDSQIESMQYLLSQGKKTDTVKLRDTIFKTPGFKLDTLLGNRWYNLKLTLTYPNQIVADVSYQSEQYIILSHKKETVEPPKKFFLARWLQRRQMVLNINVVEKSPYVKVKEQRFVEIIK